MTDMAFSSAYELIAALKSKQISSLELTDLYINRIEKFDGDINAVCSATNAELRRKSAWEGTSVTARFPLTRLEEGKSKRSNISGA